MYECVLNYEIEGEKLEGRGHLEDFRGGKRMEGQGRFAFSATYDNTVSTISFIYI